MKETCQDVKEGRGERREGTRWEQGSPAGLRGLRVSSLPYLSAPPPCLSYIVPPWSPPPRCMHQSLRPCRCIGILYRILASADRDTARCQDTGTPGCQDVAAFKSRHCKIMHAHTKESQRHVWSCKRVGISTLLRH